MPRRRQPAFPRLLAPIITILLVAVVLPAFWFRTVSRPVSPDSNKRINFTIQKGQSLDSIGQSLKETGLIRSVPAFKIQVMLSNLSTKIQAGDFAIPPNLPLSEVAQALTHGTSDRWVTILEGWRREEIAQVLVDTLSKDNTEYSFDADTFVALTRDLEGKLYPDTYSFPRPTSAQDVVDRLTNRFEQQTKDLTNNSGLSDYQALILASLIEREALADSERSIIAGILMNRLNNDWPLQVDASVQYVKTTNSCRLLTCDWWPNNLTKDDLTINSPFNTYAHPGLPPAPISNPSLTTIKAAYNPKKTDYWFYLHDLSGEIHFAKTLEEHNSNVVKYLNK